MYLKRVAPLVFTYLRKIAPPIVITSKAVNIPLNIKKSPASIRTRVIAGNLPKAVKLRLM